MKKLGLIAVLFSAFLLVSCSPEDNGSSKESNTAPIPLAGHVVADDSSLAPRDGRRIQINSFDANLSKDACIALVKYYKDQAEPDGQVSVHKPSKILDNKLNPWCIENFDGKGIQFNDYLFVSSTDVQTTDQPPVLSIEIIDYHIDLKVSKSSPDTIIATVETNLPQGSRILLTASRIFSERGSSEKYVGEIFNEEVSLTGTNFERSIKVDDRIWINERNSKKTALESVGLWSPIDKISDKVSLRAMFSTNRDQSSSVLEVLGGQAGTRMGGEQVSKIGRGKSLSSEGEISAGLRK